MTRTTPLPSAILTDFGGVMTTSVIDSFRAGSEALCGDPELVLRLLFEDDAASGLLDDHECGRITANQFEEGFAARLSVHGVEVDAHGLVAALQAGLRPDEPMLAALERLRSAGVPLAIVSNSLGDDCYRGFDLAALADVVVISGEEGVRKPSRRLYSVACERLGQNPESCVMIDDFKHNLDGAARLGIQGIHHVETEMTIAALEEMFGSVRG